MIKSILDLQDIADSAATSPELLAALSFLNDMEQNLIHDGVMGAVFNDVLNIRITIADRLGWFARH